MEPITITLQYPIEHGAETISEIVISRRPTGKDLREGDRGKGDVERSIRITSSLTGIPQAVFNKMDAADFVRVSNTVSDFLDDGQ